MGLKELQWRGRAHLGRNHAGHIIFQRHVVDHSEPGCSFDNPENPPEDLPLFPLPVKSNPNRDVIQCEGRRRHFGGSQNNFGCEAMPPGSVAVIHRIGECAHQLGFNGRPAFAQSDRNVHRTRSRLAATSPNWSAANVTSRKIAAISSPEIRRKSFSKGTTTIPHKSIAPGLTVNSPV